MITVIGIILIFWTAIFIFAAFPELSGWFIKIVVYALGLGFGAGVYILIKG